jgi:hypothetical protein
LQLMRKGGAPHRRRFSHGDRAASARRAGQRGGGEAGMISTAPIAQCAISMAEPAAARPVPLPRDARRCALSLVRAARPCDNDDACASHARGPMAERFEVYKREADPPTRTTSGTTRGRSCWSTCARAARRPRCFRGRAPCVRCDPRQLPLRTWRRPLRRRSGRMSTRFAATKADHIPRHPARPLAALLRNMAAFPASRSRAATRSSSDGVGVGDLTAEDTQEIDGQRVQVVVGWPVSSSKQAKFFVGNAPSGRRTPTPGARRSSTCRCSSCRPSIPRRSRASASPRPCARVPARRLPAMSDPSDDIPPRARVTRSTRLRSCCAVLGRHRS